MSSMREVEQLPRRAGGPRAGAVWAPPRPEATPPWYTLPAEEGASPACSRGEAWPWRQDSGEERLDRLDMLRAVVSSLS